MGLSVGLSRRRDKRRVACDLRLAWDWRIWLPLGWTRSRVKKRQWYATYSGVGLNVGFSVGLKKGVNPKLIIQTRSEPTNSIFISLKRPKPPNALAKPPKAQGFKDS